MKKISVFLCSLAMLMLFAGAVSAAPFTWVDFIDFIPDVRVPPTHSYVHNIADGDDGFQSYFMNHDTGDDQIFSYDLTVSLYDDNESSTNWWGQIIPDGSESAVIWTFGGVYSYNFSLTSNTYTNDPDQNDYFQLLGILDIYADGTLNVTISNGCLLGGGDFYVASSTLVAHGDNGSAPVPEPATMLLLGTGLLGSGIVVRRKGVNKNS